MPGWAYSLVAWTNVFIFAVIWVGFMRSAYKAAVNRKPGVRFLTAFENTNLMFRKSLYTPEGLRWVAIYRRWWFGAAVFFSLMGLFYWLTGEFPFPFPKN